jgi:hypothetical protein
MLVVVALLGACSGDDGGVTATGADAGSGVSAMLALLPPSEPIDGTPLVVAYGDLDAATDLAGASRPDDVTDVDGYADWVMEINTGGDVATLLPQTAQPRSADDLAAVADELGVSLLDVDRFVELQMPPSTLAVFVGDAGSDELESALGAPVDGILSAGDGDDFEFSPDAITAARPIGAPLRLASRDGAIAIGTSTPLVQAWLAGTPTLADDTVLAGLASRLDASTVYAATLVRWSAAGSDPTTFDAIGAGLALDDDGALGVIVYHYADDATASGAVATLETVLAGDSAVSDDPWSEYFPSWEVAADGPFVTVRLRVADGRADVLWRALNSADTLFARQG